MQSFVLSAISSGTKNWRTVLSGLLSVLPLRKRYILTRRGRVRLRYVVFPVMLSMALTAPSAAQFLSRATMSEPQMVFAEAALPEENTALEENTATDPAGVRQAMQKRLQRYARHDARTPIREEEAVEQVAQADAAVAAPPQPPAPRGRTITVGKGDTMAGVLQEAGLDGTGAYEAVETIRKFYDPRDLMPGQKIHVRLEPAADGYDFSGLTMDIDTLQTLRLQRGDDGVFAAKIDKKDTVRRSYAKKAGIELSLYGSALKAGIPASVVADAIRIFSWDVDFQRDIRQGDVLEVMYDQVETGDGTPVEGGDLLYARLNVNGQDIPLYRFEMADGTVDYFTPDGVSMRKALMSTPVDGARLSSGFGKRKHPVLGYTKMHKGMDFAAPSGTPIYAAGDGTIEKLGRFSSYGNYIRIRHNSGLKTAYAHMKGYAKGLSPGSRVKQGQVIGYIGTTGRSTGPHLHYEVMVNGVQVNPRSVKMQQGETLKGKQLAALHNHIEEINRQYAALSGSLKLASAETALRRLH